MRVGLQFLLFCFFFFSFVPTKKKGGIGIPGGTVVVSSGVVNGLFEPFYELTCLGKRMVKKNISYDLHSKENISYKHTHTHTYEKIGIRIASYFFDFDYLTIEIFFLLN